jgi:hypothetical protein
MQTRKKFDYLCHGVNLAQMSAKPRVVYPLNLDPDLDQKISIAAGKLGKTKAETMRIALEIGLARLRLINYDVYAAAAQDAATTLKVAEEAGNESSHSIRATGVRAVKYVQGRTRKS